MDIALLSMAMSQGQAQQDVSVALLKKRMGQVDQQIDGMNKLMSTADASAIQQVVHPHLGGSIDIRL